MLGIEVKYHESVVLYVQAEFNQYSSRCQRNVLFILHPLFTLSDEYEEQVMVCWFTNARIAQWCREASR